MHTKLQTATALAGIFDALSTMTARFKQTPRCADSMAGLQKHKHDISSRLGASDCQTHRPDPEGLAIRPAGATTDGPPNPAEKATQRAVHLAAD